MKNKVFVVLFIFAACFLINGCLSNIDVNREIGRITYITVGDWTFIPLNIEGSTRNINNVSLILSAADKFKKEHPDLIILKKKVEIRHQSIFTNPFIYGIWIEHISKIELDHGTINIINKIINKLEQGIPGE
ncbi:MAG: hypothetical protein AAB397_01385 [Patescibacteria group bacterium]